MSCNRDPGRLSAVMATSPPLPIARPAPVCASANAFPEPSCARGVRARVVEPQGRWPVLLRGSFTKRFDIADTGTRNQLRS